MRIVAITTATAAAAAILLVSAPIPAQKSTISPKKPLNCRWYKPPFNKRVGDHLGGTGVINSSSMAQGVNNHYQCLDGSLKGTPLMGISEVAFHQYGGASNAAANGAHTYSSVTITMAEFDYDKVSNLFAGNLAVNPAVVMKNKKVNLPDWTRLPPSFSNSPYNLNFPFDSSYTYTGKQDLCTDIVATGASFTGSRSAMAAAVLDGEPIYSCSIPKGNPNGQGCRAMGRTNDFNLFAEIQVNSATTSKLIFTIIDGPANRPAVMGLSALGLTVNIPAFCQPLMAVPMLFLSTTLNQYGRWTQPASAIPMPYGSSLVGLSLFTQMGTDDPSTGRFLLTNMSEVVGPRVWTSPDKHRFKKMAVPDVITLSGLPTTRAVPVMRYSHM